MLETLRTFFEPLLAALSETVPTTRPLGFEMAAGEPTSLNRLEARAPRRSGTRARKGAAPEAPTPALEPASLHDEPTDAANASSVLDVVAPANDAPADSVVAEDPIAFEEPVAASAPVLEETPATDEPSAPASPSRRAPRSRRVRDAGLVVAAVTEELPAPEPTREYARFSDYRPAVAPAASLTAVEVPGDVSLIPDLPLPEVAPPAPASTADIESVIDQLMALADSTTVHDIAVPTPTALDEPPSAVIEEPTPVLDEAPPVALEEPTPVPDEAPPVLLEAPAPVLDEAPPVLLDELAPVLDEAPHVTLEEPVPVLDEAPPVTLEEPAPVLDEAPPVMLDEPAPVLDEAAPVTLEEPAPVLDEAAPATLEEPAPVLDEAPLVTLEEPAPVLDEAPPVLLEEPAPVLDEAPPVLLEEPEPVLDEAPPVLLEEPAPALDEAPPVALEEPAPVLDEAPPVVLEEPASVLDEAPPAAIEEIAPLIEEPSPATVDERSPIGLAAAAAAAVAPPAHAVRSAGTAMPQEQVEVPARVASPEGYRLVLSSAVNADGAIELDVRPAAAAPGLDLRYLFRLGVLGAVIVATAMAAGLFVSSMRTPVYAGRTELLFPVESDRAAGFLREDRRVLTHVEGLQSRTILTPIAADEGIAIEDLEEQLHVEVIGGSEIIGVEIWDADPARAVRVASAIATAYRTSVETVGPDRALDLLHRELLAMRGRAQGIQQRLNELAPFIAATEDRVGVERATLEVHQLETEAGVLFARIATVESRLDDIEIARVSRAPITVVAEPHRLVDPVRPRPLWDTALAGSGGFVLAGFVVTLLWWRRKPRTRADG